MKIKEKGKLREYLLSVKDSTGEWDYVTFFEDGDWRIHSGSTTYQHYLTCYKIVTILYSFIESTRNGAVSTTLKTINKSISACFKEIEEESNEI